jgi:hypothetical protein
LIGFKALQPNFPPTFKRKKLDKGKRDMDSPVGRESPSNIFSNKYTYCTLPFDFAYGDAELTNDVEISEFYDPKRIPSFTDRILYCTLPGLANCISAQDFTSCEEVMSSDHKPVRASFLITEEPSKEMAHHFIDEKFWFRTDQHVEIVFSDMKGTGLTEMDPQAFGGLSDPYIVISCNDPKLVHKNASIIKSDIIYHNLNPVWNDSLNVVLDICAADGIKHWNHLFMSIWDYDAVSADDLIGMVSFQLVDVMNKLQRACNNGDDSGSFAFKEILLANGREQGSIEGKVSFNLLSQTDFRFRKAQYYKKNSVVLSNCGCNLQ